jgi:arylsulfatase A-like enzyme
VTRPVGTRRYLLAGSLHGAVVWGAYAVLEQALFVASPLGRGRGIVQAPTYWRVAAVIMVAYVVLGLAVGAVCGLILSALDRRREAGDTAASAVRFRGAAVLTLAVASALSWSLVRPFSGVEALCVAASVALAIGLLLGETRPAWSDRLELLADPWVAGLLMFGSGWIGRKALDNSSRSVQFAGAAITLILCGCAGAVVLKIWRKRGFPADSFLPARGAALVVAAGAVVLGVVPHISRWTLPPALPVQPGGPGARPNVVLVTLDTVRADHLSLLGYERDTTPFLRELAKKATVYEQAVATSNITLTTHASLFTGLYGSWHGAHMELQGFPQGRPLGERHPTLAQILTANGYRTAAVVANYAYLGPGFRVLRGFQRPYLLAPVLATTRFLLRRHLELVVDVVLSSDELGARYVRADEVNQVASELLGQASRGSAPFFLFVNYMDAHAPYVPPAPYNTIFPGRDRSLRADHFDAMDVEVMHGARGVSGRERRHFVSQYDGAIMYLDAQIGRLVARLEELGLYDNTLIVITSDHGEAFGERNCVGHGTTPYQDQVRVPLIVKYPGQSDPRAIRARVSQVDVMPTVLDVLGIPSPAPTQGVSLLDAERGAPRFVLTESFPNLRCGPRFMRMERAVFSGSMKLVDLGNGEWELYDLARDPDETANRYRRDDPGAAVLSAYLERWLKEKPQDRGDSGKLDEETLRRLKSLGYL